MEDGKFYLSIVAILVSAFFFGYLIYSIWKREAQNLVTAEEIQRAREIVRRLELGEST